MCPNLYMVTSFTLCMIVLFDQFAIAHFLPLIHSQEQEQQHLIGLPEECHEKCGSFRIPFPFYLNLKAENNTSCWSWRLSDAFHLSCINSSSLYLTIASQTYRVLHFFPDGLLVDFPNTSLCHHYNDLQSFTFSGNEYFGISADNILVLYDCEDSSLCKADCESSTMPGCDDYGGDGDGDGGGGGGHPACCYPLFDHSAWHVGDSFSMFSQFGCRGFSSWTVLSSSKGGKRGIKLEWAIPKNSSKATCATDADIINATSVKSGIRCKCRDGFTGDGFTVGVGCLKSCLKDGKEAYGKECYLKSSGRRRAEILAGVLTSAFTVTSLTAMLCLLKRPIKSDTFDTDHSQSTISFRKVYRTQPFTYYELEAATKGFDEGLKLLEGSKGALYAGTLEEGSKVAVHKLKCESERDLIQVLSCLEVLSSVSHKNMARLLGWSIDSSCITCLVVYEYPANGTTLEKHLTEAREQNVGFDWCRRLKTVAETSSLLSFLQSDVCPPISHHNLQSSCIFLDEESTAKISGFELLNANTIEDCQSHESEGSHIAKSDVYSLGLVVLELITGDRFPNLSTINLQKIRGGKLEEVVDPGLYYHEQPAFCREQIERAADLATRCLLYGGEGKLSMADVAKELANILKDSVDGSSRRGPALEETFSNSSLLQMISMSPDSLYAP